MGRFGEQLRKERESRGVTLQTISEKTKVIVRYLSALEDDNFTILPGGILGKGIMRGYIRAVGLDEEVWIERFLAVTREMDPAQNGAGWAEFAENVHRARPRSREHSHRGRWAGAAVVFLLLVGGWIAWRFVSNRVMADELPHPGVTATAAATPGTPQ